MQYCQPEEKRSVSASFPLCQWPSLATASRESLYHPKCHPAVQKPRERPREEQLQEPPGSQCQKGRPSSLGPRRTLQPASVVPSRAGMRLAGETLRRSLW